MIQQSQIPTNTPLESIAPSENYPTTDPNAPGRDEQPFSSSSSSSTAHSPSSSSSSSPDQSLPAGSRRVRADRPGEKQQNSLGSGETPMRPQGRRARAKPARISQKEGEGKEEEEAAKSSSNTDEDEEEQGQDQMHISQHDATDDAEASAATNPAEHYANPNHFHHAPDQLLSPIGYISGFVRATNPSSHTPSPSSPLSLSLSSISVPTNPSSDPQPVPESDIPPESASDSPQHREGEEQQHALPAAAARSAAVQLLLGFMGALQASQYAVESFVSNAIAYYRYVPLSC